MSAIQSHTITEAEENSFNFPPQPRLTQMNVRPDILRQQSLSQLPSQMLSLNAPRFPPNQQQPGQHQQHQQHQQQQHMGLLSNATNSNPSLGIMAATPPNNNAALQQYQLHMQSANMQQGNQRRVLVPQSQQPQSLNSSGSASASHLGHTPSQLGFPDGIMHQSGNNVPLRRVPSQPQSLNQSSGHLGGAVNGMNMGMNPQTSMPGQLRQVTTQQQQQQQQMNSRMQQQFQGQISPELAMALSRQGNAALSQNVSRAAPSQAQILGSLAQPPALTQAHLGAMPPSHHQNSAQNAIPLPHQQPQISHSPRPGSHPQAHTPSNMPIPTQPSSQTAAPRAPLTTDEALFMSFPNAQFQQAARLPGNNGQFPFVPSSTPPAQHGDAPQSINAGLPNPPGPSNRGGFQMTPAQGLEHMQLGENHGPHYKTHPAQSNAPPRSISHTNRHSPETLALHQQPPPPPHHPSPRPSEPMGHIAHPPRPHSQPLAQPVRPPSQTGSSHTPHTSQAQFPANVLPPGRMPAHPQQHGNSQQQQQQPQQLQFPVSGHVPARPSISSTSVPSTTLSSSSLPLPEGGAMHTNPRVREMVPLMADSRGLLRLLQFSGLLASENKSKLQLSYWENLVNEYFTPKAIMKFTLWKDNQRNEAKPFEIGVPILPRFFLVTAQSGVKSMTLSLDGARERIFPSGHTIVECPTAVWTYKYANGYTVTLRGPLNAQLVIYPLNVPTNPSVTQSTPQPTQFSLKFENLQFDANWHDKYIALESVMGQRITESPKTPRTRNVPTPTANGIVPHSRDDDKKWEEPRVLIERASIPGEPVNAFGIPQATMRCLELAESVASMADLISFSNEYHLGPLEALSKFASKLRESQPQNTGPLGTGIAGGSTFPIIGSVTASPAVTLYSTAPPSVNSSTGSQTAPSMNSPQTRPQSADSSPLKQNKALPQSSQAPVQTSAPVPPPSATAVSGQLGTPSMANATLKRKSETNSPTVANAEQAPPAKRVTRKRGRTTGGG